MVSGDFVNDPQENVIALLSLVTRSDFPLSGDNVISESEVIECVCAGEALFFSVQYCNVQVFDDLCLRRDGFSSTIFFIVSLKIENSIIDFR